MLRRVEALSICPRDCDVHQFTSDDVDCEYFFSIYVYYGTTTVDDPSAALVIDVRVAKAILRWQGKCTDISLGRNQDQAREPLTHQTNMKPRDV